MEVDLKCNVAQFDCANNTFTSALVCPACETSLTENDDIVFTDLNPNEDYKASVLSGLRPDIIVEICSRSLSFWTYQTTQEAYFQKMLYKNLQEKCSQLEKQMQSVIRDAQEEIASIQKDLELEKHKNHDFAEQLQEKTRQFSKLQIMYDKLKRRSLVPAMQQTQQGTNRLYGNPQSWNLKNNSQEYRLNSDQIPFAPCNVNGGRKTIDGNDANKNFQSNAHFPPIRNPFVMKSNTGMRVMAPSGGVR
ncbi:5759_t:CDS:2 [Entrophospora sp. SA101]|nr:5759_t:CDS:2 [Entrophospora sp. SA101]